MHKPIVAPEFIDAARDIHIRFTVFGNLVQFTIAEPFHGLHTIGGFCLAEGCLRQRIQTQTKAECAMNILQHIRRADGAQVFVRRVWLQNLIIEVEDVEADHAVSGFQLRDQCRRVLFPIDGKIISRRGPRHTASEQQLRWLAPADFFK